MPGRAGHACGWPARGSAYLAVLGGSLLVTVIGIGALSAAQSRRAAAELEVSAWKAKVNAQSGIDLAMKEIAGDSNWRNTKAGGTILSSTNTGDGRVRVTATDPTDSDLSDSNADPFDLTAVGAHGIARHTLRVRIGATAPALSCLGVALASAGAHTHTTTTISSDHTISSNAAILATLANISGRVEATLAATGLTYTGTVASLQPAREFPDTAIISRYAARGSTISWSSIPTVSGKKTIQNLLISAASPPLGATSNAEGIYAIDCGGNDLIIQNCRIVGTLVLRNAGGGTTIQGSVNWSEGTVGYPILLVDGSASLAFTKDTNLNENDAANPNFNPAGTPYSGSTDNDKTDSYPSEMNGLVYITGSLNTSNSPKVTGCVVVGGLVTTSGTLTLRYNAAYSSSPPPGFTGSATLVIIPGTWQQVVE